MFALKAVPELATAWFLYSIWLEPLRFGDGWLKVGVMTLLLEFFVVHSAGFMAVVMYDPETSRKKRALQVLGLSLFYILFISGFALGFDAWWMLSAFAWLVFSKLQAIWSDGPPTEKDRFIAIASWALSVAVYLLSVGASVMNDWPPLGVTSEVREAAGFTGGGEWEKDPWRALVAGVIYFSVMGFSRPLFALWQRGGKKEKQNLDPR